MRAWNSQEDATFTGVWWLSGGALLKSCDSVLGCRNSAAEAVQAAERAADLYVHPGLVCAAAAGLLPAGSRWREHQQAHQRDLVPGTRLPDPAGRHL